MAVQVHNTLTGRLEPIEPLQGRRLGMFVCGPTVYADAHIGHARTYVAFDVIARWLRRRGYAVFYLMNVTDIDDKIIVRARERRMEPAVLAETYLARFIEDMEAMGATSVNLYARATYHLPEIIEQVQGLIRAQAAYPAGGDVYFDVPRFPRYGELSRVTPAELKAGARVEVDSRKKSPGDFALWKAREAGEPSWDSPWGPGRPGWHIEDTAIAQRYFGAQYDLHGGARDLIFPHHEAEIAIAESLTGKRPYVRAWLHTGFLNVGGEKMSKSLGNFITIREAIEKTDADILRFFFLHTHYRSPIDFTPAALDEARAAYQRARLALDSLRAAAARAPKSGKSDAPLQKAARAFRADFEKAMDSDFNTREALTALFQFITQVNTALEKGAGAAATGEALAAFEGAARDLGLFQKRDTAPAGEEPLLALLADLREKLRAKKDYELTDQIRKGLEKAGWVLEDSPKGPKWRRK